MSQSSQQELNPARVAFIKARWHADIVDQAHAAFLEWRKMPAPRHRPRWLRWSLISSVKRPSNSRPARRAPSSAWRDGRLAGETPVPQLKAAVNLALFASDRFIHSFIHSIAR